MSLVVICIVVALASGIAGYWFGATHTFEDIVDDIRATGRSSCGDATIIGRVYEAER